MSESNFKAETAGARSADRLIGLPALQAATTIAADARQGERGSALRRRLGVMRTLQPFDDGLRPFRVY